MNAGGGSTFAAGSVRKRPARGYWDTVCTASERGRRIRRGRRRPDTTATPTQNNGPRGRGPRIARKSAMELMWFFPFYDGYANCKASRSQTCRIGDGPRDAEGDYTARNNVARNNPRTVARSGLLHGSDFHGLRIDDFGDDDPVTRCECVSFGECGQLNGPFLELNLDFSLAGFLSRERSHRPIRGRRRPIRHTSFRRIGGISTFP